MFNRPASILLSILKLFSLVKNPCYFADTEGRVSGTDISNSYLFLIIASLLDQFTREAV
jgi:hypothetical protein